MTTDMEHSEQAQDAPVPRREERSPTNWIATIRFRDGTEIPCTVKDVSKSGARICIGAKQDLPPVFMLRIIGRDFLCLVRVAWRRGDYVGVRIERVGKVPSAAAATAPVAQPVPVTSEPTTQAAVPDGGGLGVPSRKRGISAF
ncbi:PilZ domain-containing protein [Methylobacterium sp. Leaf113]|uniref:PilZ domain-containing protein n=1 Tax=Methylobacterium sp. Leaf113 TaxID=1736259 RepID=UPI001FCDBD85|nr:PilZ domain-containing protein [Methylobacterium sp. Leaf113]